MPKRIVPLSDVQVRNAKPLSKGFKLFDGGGLFLMVTPAGGKLWHFKYHFGGKEKKLSFGAYPAISLTAARQRREDAKKLLTNGVDPGAVKKAQKAATVAETENSFEIVAREWHGRFSGTWSACHAETTIGRLQLDVFPVLGARPIAEIKAPELLAMLRRIESRGALETAHRVRTICGQIFRYAVATGRAERDPAADLKGALPPYKKSNLAAITDPKEVAPLLRAINDYKGSFVVKSALQLAPLVIVRPGELRQAEWAEIDLDAAEWNIPAERMKMKKPHLVPLSCQAVAILRELQALTGKSQYLFPCHRSFVRPMSNNAINAALRRMGFEKDEMTGHGFRAMARTILDEVLQVRPDYIEHQLAHAVKDPNGRAYNRTAHIAERRKMMQQWADYLDGLKAGTCENVAPLVSAPSEVARPSQMSIDDPNVIAVIKESLSTESVRETVLKVLTEHKLIPEQEHRKRPGPNAESANGLMRKTRNETIVKDFYQMRSQGKKVREIEEALAEAKCVSVKCVQSIITKHRKDTTLGYSIIDRCMFGAIKVLFDTYMQSYQVADNAYSALVHTLHKHDIQYPEQTIRSIVEDQIKTYSIYAGCDILDFTTMVVKSVSRHVNNTHPLQINY